MDAATDQWTPEHLSNWLRFAHGRGVGARTRTRLLDHFDTPTRLFRATDSDLRRLGITQPIIRAIRSPPPRLADQLALTLDWLNTIDHHVVTYQDTRYPACLRAIPAPPVLLYVAGNPDLLDSPAIALVGSRKPTVPGQTLAQEIGESLGTFGITVVSGLAYGIDAAAHEGCLAGSGATIAVLGTGLDQVYPDRHRPLAAKIQRHGALVSEFALGTPPLGRHFPQRNRIISGLSLAIVVIEAALRSGTLSTARHALEQGREVMAVPGAVRSPLSRGCHRLLREGATLVESGADILTEIAPQIDTDTLLTAGSSATARIRSSGEGTVDAPLDPTCQHLLDLMGYESVTIDWLISGTGLPVSQVTTSLLQLELSGVVSVDNGGRYARC